MGDFLSKQKSIVTNNTNYQNSVAPKSFSQSLQSQNSFQVKPTKIRYDTGGSDSFSRSYSDYSTQPSEKNSSKTTSQVNSQLEMGAGKSKKNSSTKNAELSALAKVHFSPNSQESAVSYLYRLSIQNATKNTNPDDPNPKIDYPETLKLARSKYNEQIQEFLKAAKNYCDENGGCEDVNIKAIIRSHLHDAKKLIVDDTRDSVAKNIELSRDKYYQDNAKRGFEMSLASWATQSIRPFGGPELVVFDAFTKEGYNSLADRASKVAFSKLDGSDSNSGRIYNMFGIGALRKWWTSNDELTEQAMEIANQAIKYADDQINLDLNEAFKNSEFASQPEPPPPPEPPKPDDRWFAGIRDWWNSPWSSGGSSDGCFISGTKILLKDGVLKNIEEMEEGDEVLCYNEVMKEAFLSPVTEVLHHESKKQTLHHFTLSDGSSFTSNAVHPIYIQNQDRYARASEIYGLHNNQIPIALQNSKGDVASISEIVLEERDVPVYNLHVAGVSDSHPVYGYGGVGHNYYANGVLVHNYFAK